MLIKWLKSRGLNVAVKKTKYVFFSRTSTDKINLNIDSQLIKQEEEAKFLGIIFDLKLTWKSHINFTHKRAAAACNMLKPSLVPLGVHTLSVY